METLPGVIVRSEHQGRAISFFLNNPNDVIQSWHYRGQFYEIEELQIIAKWFRGGEVFLDVGANIGNHTVYLCAILHAKQSIVIEPNPPAISLLNVNIDLNGLRGVVDASLLGVGLSDIAETAAVHMGENNLGGARMVSGHPNASLRLVNGDSLLLGRKIDFIKMDIEGCEIKALAGLQKVIAANRPRMFIEVETVNFAKFNSLIESIDYRIVERLKRYPSNENFMVVPVESL